ncbi:MAG: glycosyltransferase family 2 protein [Zoogloeaceae bacterium]|nr:glycosyltransferase family 2 protein [Zoogloeaceae bacterium]
MSTYNGELFIGDQVRSILMQLPENGRLLVRDDGSDDSTVSQIEAFGDSRISVLRGENIGFARSFLWLLMKVPADIDMVMFSDQDDVWLPDKISRAWSSLMPFNDRPALYCSAQTLVDASLRPMQITPPWPRGPSFSGALSENIVTGCTAALNQKALGLLQCAGIPKGVHFHDWWLYLVVSAFGTVVVDDQPSLLYRQHGKNLIGHGFGYFGRQIQIVRFLLRNDWVGIMLKQVAALKRCYGHQLGVEQVALLEKNFCVGTDGAWPRWSMILGKFRWRQTLLQEALFRGLLGMYRLRLWPLPGKRLK